MRSFYQKLPRALWSTRSGSGYGPGGSGSGPGGFGSGLLLDSRLEIK